MYSTSRRFSPRSKILTAGKRTPSAQMSGAFDVVAARRAAAGVGVMALDGRDQHALAVVEDRREDVVVGQVAAAVVRIVGDQHVAVEEAVLAEELDREAHRQRRATA